MIAPPRKPCETAADYMAVCACPALIMTLVGSLVLLLLEASYAGPWLGSMRWTLCWFTFAIVLVSRIAIERGRVLAVCYGAALGGATSAYLAAHFGFVLPVWILLGVVWWVSDRLTWDCTLMDEEADSSGSGLMQSGRLELAPGAKGGRVRIVGAPGPPPAPPAQNPKKPVDQRPKRPAKKQDLHAPGKWVLYFSLAAVPIFGLGEILLPSREPGARVFAFWLLLVYLASAAGLLLLTSFLGLRRYLRQRWLQMPAAIAVAWINSGVWLIAALLLAAILLPRPVTPYSLDRLVAGERAADSGKGRAAEAPPEQKEEEKKTEGAQAKRPGENSSPGEGARSGSAPGKERLRLPAWGAWFARCVAVVVVLVLAFRFRAELLRALRGFLAGLRSRPKSKPAAGPGLFRRAPASAPAPGLGFSNPFESGLAAGMTPEGLLRYSFDAAQAWAKLRGAQPEDHETPVEFAERLSRRVPSLEREIRLLSRYYSHLAYAGRSPPPEAQAVLRKLWTCMTFNKL